MPVVIPKNELNEFSLPRVCVATGQSGPVTFQKVQFQYIPKWVAIFALAPLLYLIFYLIVRKTARGTLPFTEPAWSAVKAARRNVALAVVALIVLGMGGPFLMGIAGAAPDVLTIFSGFLLGIAAVIITSLRIRKVFPMATLIDEGSVTLKLPSPEAERLFMQHLSAGARVLI
jgi:hypothetical protein